TIAGFEVDADRAGCRAERVFQTCLSDPAPAPNGSAPEEDPCDTRRRWRKLLLLNAVLRHTNSELSTAARPFAGGSAPPEAMADEFRPIVAGPWHLFCAALLGEIGA